MRSRSGGFDLRKAPEQSVEAFRRDADSSVSNRVSRDDEIR